MLIIIIISLWRDTQTGARPHVYYLIFTTWSSQFPKTSPAMLFCLEETRLISFYFLCWFIVFVFWICHILCRNKRREISVNKTANAEEIVPRRSLDSLDIDSSSSVCIWKLTGNWSLNHENNNIWSFYRDPITKWRLDIILAMLEKKEATTATPRGCNAHLHSTQS